MTMQSVDMRGPVRAALARPEIVDKAKGLCRIKVNEPDLPVSAHAGVYIILSQWYRGMVYPVEKIEKGYLYFRSGKVTSDRNAETDPDADYKVMKELPHYILYNHPNGGLDLSMTEKEILGKGTRRLHQSEATNFLTVSNSQLGSFTLQGATFVTNHAGSCLIHFDGVSSTETAIRDCRFAGIRSGSIGARISFSVTMWSPGVTAGESPWTFSPAGWKSVTTVSPIRAT